MISDIQCMQIYEEKKEDPISPYMYETEYLQINSECDSIRGVVVYT